MLLCDAERGSWQDREYLGSLSTRMTAEKDYVGEISRWLGTAEKMQQSTLHANDAALNHPRSTALGHSITVSANSDNVAESGLCPTGIPALFLWRTLHQVPLFLLKSTQWTLSRMERPSDRMRTPTCKVTAASNVHVNELRAGCASGLWLSSPGWDFTHGWFECRGDFSSHQKGQLELWLVSTASTAIVEVSTFNSEFWLLSSLLKRVCMARVMGHPVHFGRRQRGWPLFCRAREPWPQFNTTGGSLFKELSKVAVGCQAGRHFAICYQKTIKLRSREL